MNDWSDRLVDAALHEVHGQQPPDLSARVLAALGEATAGPLPRLLPPARPPRWRAAAMLGVAALLGVVVALFAAMHRSAPTTAAVAAVPLMVLAGDVECVEASAHRTVTANATGVTLFDVAIGNRLHTPSACTFRLMPFGDLDTHTHTILEVRSMQFTTEHGVIAVSSLALGVVAGAVTYQALTRTETANAGDVLHMRAVDNDTKAVAAENDNLRRRLQALEQQNGELQAAIARRDAAPLPTPPVEAGPEAAPPAPPAPVTAALAFSDPRFAEALGKIDWTKVGSLTNAMGPLLTELAKVLTEEGAELPVDLAVEVQKLNAQLLDPVKALLQAGIPGFGPNGSYTHPLVVANTLAASLAAAGQPLSAAQQQQVDGLVRAFAAEQQAISDGEHDFALSQLLAETEMKERFFKEVGGVLAPGQHGVVYPEGAMAHEGTSLFSAGVLLRVHAEPVQVRDAGDYARVVGSKVGEYLGLDEAQAARVRAVVARVAGNPDLWRDRASPVETSQAHFLRSGRTQAAMRTQLEWMRMIEREAGLTPEQVKKLRKSSRVLVPLPR